MKLFLATPGYSGTASVGFEQSLKDSISLLQDNGIEVVDWGTLVGCCYLPVARNKLVQRFLESDATDFMFIDADLSWNPKDMLAMLKHDRDIIAGIYRLKTEREGYPVLLYIDSNERPIIDQDGLLAAEGIPTGFMKIKRSVFEKFINTHGDELVIEEPDHDMNLQFSYYNFFDCEKVGTRWIGEDYNFCRKWRLLGGDIWVYPDITFTHYGYREFVGNYHEYLMRQPGGLYGPKTDKAYNGNDITGWMTEAELQWLYSQSTRFNTIAEIGSFEGRSAHALLSGCNGRVYCIDQWKSYHQGIDGDTDEKAEERYNNFIENTNFPRKSDLTVLRCNSVLAGKMLPDIIDMTFIDGDHTSNGLYNDLITWLPKTKKLICGHDYNVPGWKDVKPTVDAFFGDKVRVIDSIWYVNL